MREDLFDDRLLQDRRDDLELATAIRAVRQVELEHPLERPGPAQPHRSVVHTVRPALVRLCLLGWRLGLLRHLLRHHQRRAGDVAAQLLQRIAVIGRAANGCVQTESIALQVLRPQAWRGYSPDVRLARPVREPREWGR